MITPFRMAVVVAIGGLSHVAVNTPHPFEVEEPACVAAKNWVQAHPEALTFSYAEFTAHEGPVQKAIYSALEGDARLSLWRAHIDGVLAKVELTSNQRTFLRSVRSDLPLYLDASGEPEVLNLEARAMEVLGEELTQLALIELGAWDRPSEEFGEACSCSTVHDRCSENYECGTDGDGCDPIACGFMGMDTCNGECFNDVETQ